MLLWESWMYILIIIQPCAADVKLVKQKGKLQCCLRCWHPERRRRDPDLPLTAPLYVGGRRGRSIKSICSFFSAPFRLASAVNHCRRYINDFKTRWDTIKRNYARFLSHASFNGLADFVWAQQCRYPSDAPYPRDALAQHVDALCACFHNRLKTVKLHMCPQKHPKPDPLISLSEDYNGLLWNTAKFQFCNAHQSPSNCFRIV